MVCVTEQASDSVAISMDANVEYEATMVLCEGCKQNSPTKENMAAEMRPILSPKLSKPAASAERVTVKLSHDKTAIIAPPNSS